MRIVIFGATGRIGMEALRCALEHGDEVRAASRTVRVADRPGVIPMAVDVRDPEGVSRAVADTDAVIAAMGPRSNTAEDEEALAAGMENIVRAMTSLGVGRLVVLSGAGIAVPNDQKPAIDRLVSVAVRRLAKHVVRAKQREYEVIAASNLRWTALRPPLVVDGPERGYRLDLKLRPGARVTRADVGRAMFDQVRDETFLRQAPFILPPR